MLRHYQTGTSLLHRSPPELKITAVFVLALAVLFFNNVWFYLILLLSLVALTTVSKTPFIFLISKTKRYWSLLAIAFLLPVFFNSGSNTVATIASFHITYEGLCAGALFASRIFFLLFASCLLMRTTSPEELTRGLARVLSPLSYLGISQQRVATILSLAWNAIPQVWAVARGAIFSANFKKAENLRNLLPMLSDLIAKLYLNTESELAKTMVQRDPGRESRMNAAPLQ
jgi:energy-coupling factor transport system permease protein